MWLYPEFLHLKSKHRQQRSRDNHLKASKDNHFSRGGDGLSKTDSLIFLAYGCFHNLQTGQKRQKMLKQKVSNFLKE